jgi:hypothetical protein
MVTKTLTEQDELTIVKMLAGGRDADFVATALSLPKDAILTVAVSHGHPDKAKLGWAADIMQSNLDQKKREALPRATPDVARQVRRPDIAQSNPPSRPLVSQIPATSTASAPQLPTQMNLATTPKQDMPSVIELGLGSHVAKTRNLAGRIRDQLQQLREIFSDEAEDRVRMERETREREAALAQVASLEAQLKAAKAKLNGKGFKTYSRPTGSAVRSSAIAKRHEHQREVLEQTGATLQEIRDWAALNGHQVGKSGLIPRAVLDAFEADRS